MRMQVMGSFGKSVILQYSHCNSEDNREYDDPNQEEIGNEVEWVLLDLIPKLVQPIF